MALSPEGQRLTQQFRQRQLSIRAAALRDLTAMWRAVDPANLRGTIEPFARAVSVLARSRYLTAAEVGVIYYRALREVEGARGPMVVAAPDPPSREEFGGLLRGAALSGIINARRSGFSIDAAGRNGLVKVSGQLTKSVLAGGREAVTGAALTDPRAGRWERVTDSSPCDWCADLAGSPTSERFRSHDHCGCTAAPVF